MKVTERQITKALKARHDRRGDYFGSQIKMGRAGSKIIDAIAIPVTWSPRTVIGYEIKCSRQDFVNDHKYPHYMTTCNEFYFVVVKGIVKKDEIPSDVGLIEYNPKSGTLRTVKKAPYRKVDINVDMLLHCIFYKLVNYKRPKTKQEHLEDVKASIESKDYGKSVSKKISMLSRQLERYEEKRFNENYNYNWHRFSEMFKNRFGYSPGSISTVLSLIPDNPEKVKRLLEASEMIEKAYNILQQETD